MGMKNKSSQVLEFGMFKKEETQNLDFTDVTILYLLLLWAKKRNKGAFGSAMISETGPKTKLLWHWLDMKIFAEEHHLKGQELRRHLHHLGKAGFIYEKVDHHFEDPTREKKRKIPTVTKIAFNPKKIMTAIDRSGKNVDSGIIEYIDSIQIKEYLYKTINKYLVKDSAFMIETGEILNVTPFENKIRKKLNIEKNIDEISEPKFLTITEDHYGPIETI
jgi:hypothetical protein